MAQVYKIMNTATGAFYLGCTTNRRLSQRMKTHRYRLRRGQHGNKPLQAAWDKHGEAAFEIIFVEAVPAGVSAEAVEEQHLALHVGKPYCYNVSRFAHRTASDRVFTDEHRAMRRAMLTGAGNTFFGKKHTPEARAKIGAATAARHAAARSV
jgi:group I intron endonuclease